MRNHSKRLSHLETTENSKQVAMVYLRGLDAETEKHVMTALSAKYPEYDFNVAVTVRWNGRDEAPSVVVSWPAGSGRPQCGMWGEGGDNIDWRALLEGIDAHA